MYYTGTLDEETMELTPNSTDTYDCAYHYSAALGFGSHSLLLARLVRLLTVVVSVLVVIADRSFYATKARAGLSNTGRCVVFGWINEVMCTIGNITVRSLNDW